MLRRTSLRNCLTQSAIAHHYRCLSRISISSRPFPRQLGSLNALEILTLHNNRVKRLPSTTGNLCNLKELDVSFHKLEFVPESLCFATNLKKLNLGKNFADLRALPTSIGNLEMLEELDISDDQIKALPKSLRFLFKLRVFRAVETPLEVPPRELIKLGAQVNFLSFNVTFGLFLFCHLLYLLNTFDHFFHEEVVQYMADFVTKRDAKLVPSKKKKKGFWFWFCSIFCPQNRNKPKWYLDKIYKEF
ncbi:Plant intracellular Ras-group-related LRR protein 5 [Glycine max]|nr:Plant intracellular Ras-group-related LRR protein 5 [Glycine max]